MSPPGLSQKRCPDCAPLFRRSVPLPPKAMRAFEKGARLFIMDWSGRADGIGNATSCLDCHSVPMPGGSGMSNRALVSIDAAAPPGTREEVIQRPHGADGMGPLRRTPALFGIGFLERAEARTGPAGVPLGVHGRQRDLKAFVSSAFATELGVSTSMHCSRSRPGEAYRSICKPRLREVDWTSVAYLRSGPAGLPGAQAASPSLCSAKRHVRAAMRAPQNDPSAPPPSAVLVALLICVPRCRDSKGCRTIRSGLELLRPPYLSAARPVSRGAVLAHAARRW